jgi:hypothetical protein
VTAPGSGFDLNDLASQIIVGTTAGFVSAWVSIVVFRSQRRWERRETGYEEVLEALQKMKASNDEQWNYEITYREMSPEKIEYVSTLWRAGKETAFKYADIGSNFLSDDVEKVLSKFRDELENHSEFHSLAEEIDYHSGCIRRTLNAVKQMARQDAKRSGRFWKFRLKLDSEKSN